MIIMWMSFTSYYKKINIDFMHHLNLNLIDPSLSAEKNQFVCIKFSSRNNWQSVSLDSSPKPLSSKYSFGLVKNIQIEYIL